MDSDAKMQELCLAHLRHNHDLYAQAMAEDYPGEELAPSPYIAMTPRAIDQMVTSSWGMMSPVLIQIEPWHTLVMGMFTIHAGASGRPPIKVSLQDWETQWETEGAESEDRDPTYVVPPDYRYHR